MSGTTSVPSPTFGPTGLLLPAESDVLAGVLADINAAFGNRLQVANSAAPHGQLAQTFAAAIGDKNNLVLYFTQMVDPLYSEGRMQDAIARIYFITRNPAQSTLVQATCSGAPGVVIPDGALAYALDGTAYNCVGGGTIGPSGTAVLPFVAATPGPIACPAGTLTRMGLTVPGWDSITNAADGVMGNLAESPADFEARRAASVAGNGQGGIPNVRGAVLGVPGVVDAYVIDNPGTASMTVGDVTLPAHSLYVAVAGGDPTAVAEAIWSKKAPGVSMVGNVTVSVEDQTYADEPRPTYPITFQSAAPVTVYFAVSLTNNAQVPSDAVAQIQAAIAAAWTTTVKPRIGGTVYASRFFPVVQALGSWANEVIDISIGTSAPASGKTVTVGIDQIPAVSPGNVTVTLV